MKSSVKAKSLLLVPKKKEKRIVGQCLLKLNLRMFPDQKHRPLRRREGWLLHQESLAEKDRRLLLRNLKSPLLKDKGGLRSPKCLLTESEGKKGELLKQRRLLLTIPDPRLLELADRFLLEAADRP
jgi:hypothetical protein